VSADWIRMAKEWQSSHPLASKDNWHSANPGRWPTSPLRCYNCTTECGNYSYACTKARVTPERPSALVASLTQLSPSLPKISETTEPAATVETGKGPDE
jgi:hypothetical protein